MMNRKLNTALVAVLTKLLKPAYKKVIYLPSVRNVRRNSGA